VDELATMTDLKSYSQRYHADVSALLNELREAQRAEYPEVFCFKIRAQDQCGARPHAGGFA
jgi:hypothetical protein